MSSLPEQITLGPEEEARRLWEGASKAFANAPDDVVALCEALDLGLHAAEILVIHGLQPVKDQFPATIVLQLETPDPDVDVHRDAINVPKALQFTDALDLLSADGLECVGPRLHRGWEDRRFACARSRKLARGALDCELGESQRDDLLLLAAYRNRVFRYPPPIRIMPAPMLDAFASLEKLVRHLLDRS